VRGCVGLTRPLPTPPRTEVIEFLFVSLLAGGIGSSGRSLCQLAGLVDAYVHAGAGIRHECVVCVCVCVF